MELTLKPNTVFKITGNMLELLTKDQKEQICEHNNTFRREKTRNYNKEYYINNKEKIAANQKEYREKNKI